MSTMLTATAFSPPALPDTLPLFPLTRVVLLPRAKLPLHIFEPRYLAMVDDALRTQHRMIGMIQPSTDASMNTEDVPPLYSVGCAGRITSFAELEDGRLMIVLSGICRFDMGNEIRDQNPYRSTRPSWDRFLDDTKTYDALAEAVDHERLSALLKPYFKAQNIEADWPTIDGLSDETLISTLTMICPLAPNEKQALLEAPDLSARASMLMTLLEMASKSDGDAAARLN